MTENPYIVHGTMNSAQAWQEGYEAGRASRDAEVEAAKRSKDAFIEAVIGQRDSEAEENNALRARLADREKLDTIESALDAERKAGELVGAIEILQRMVTGWGMVSKESVFAELDRLRAEKAKLG